MAKPSWRDYFMRLAYITATRATCDRKHVGAVVVSSTNRVVSMGYNGAPSGQPSCDEVGHELVEGHCVRSIHSEANAISYAGQKARGCTIYCTCIPCYDCAKLIVQVGIDRVIFDEFYPSRYSKSDQVPAFLRAAEVEVIQHDSFGLSAFKKKLDELEALEADVLATQLVEYICGCSLSAAVATPTCYKHMAQRVTRP